MGYNIGMDFGTTNSTISYIDNGKTPAAFRYPGPDGYEYIPSCVAYDPDGAVCIGRAALDNAGDPDMLFCNNLKMVLPQTEEERKAHGWAKKKRPEAVIEDYLQHILLLESDEAISFKTQKGSIDGIVFSVPHVWDRAMNHAGRSRLQAIVSENLKLPLIRLISEPVAAAAYYAFAHRQKASKSFTGNLLICDTGGGTFDVTLCQISPGKVEELHNDGNGRLQLGKAGVRFDQRLLLNAMKKAGKPQDANDPDFLELYVKLQEYKVNHHANITKRIKNAMDEPDLREQYILKAGRIKFNFNDIQEAFKDIEAGIVKVLERVKTAMDEKKQDVDALFFVGGFSQFYLVRETVRNFWKDKRNCSGNNERANQETSRFAISYGAALIANDMIQVEEKYEHTIGVEGYRLIPDKNPGEFCKEAFRIPVIIGGKKLSEYDKVCHAQFAVKAHNESPDIVLYVDPESKGRIVKQKLPESLKIKLPNVGLPGNQWKLGMRINRSKVVYLIFEDMRGEALEYELGDILRQMFGGLEILVGEERS